MFKGNAPMRNAPMKRVKHPAVHHDAASDPRWAAVINRDAAQDLHFVYAVRTTGVYCRPSSPSRLPRPENVEFFDNAAEAEAAGYRPSKRAHSDQTRLATHNAALIAAACRHITEAEHAPALHALAAEAGISPWHFHRIFKAVTGLTPKAYAVAHRGSKMRSRLLTKGSAKESPGGSITEALYDAGFNSNSRFYEASDKLLGMKATDYRKGGANTEIHFALGECFLGSILVAQSVRGVCAILLGDDPEQLLNDLQDQFHTATLVGGDAKFEQLIAQVVGFIEAPGVGLNLPLDLQGTAFQQRVWQALLQIPPGTTASYGEIAKRIGAPTSYRAVAQACGANRLAVAIPCHRVVRSDGDLSGYRWGVERKQKLIDREAQPPGCAPSPNAD
jgi:AraC family transcriptional regulator of adaptative response/methylated-DNA-[protein]-cysteine methyltransferase